VAVVSNAGAGPGLLMETGRRHEDMQRRAVRAACARGPSAATITADRPEASRRVEAPASVAGFMVAEGATAVAAGDGNRTPVVFAAQFEDFGI
jgi:hypothetical protein